MRRKRYQHGSLQKRPSSKNSRTKVWVLLWRENNTRKYKTLGPCSEMSRREAEVARAEIIQRLNVEAGEIPEDCTFGTLVSTIYLPFYQRKWKTSTRGTTEQRIKAHLLPDFGPRECREVTRDELQAFLEAKAAIGLSASVVNHLRWDLKAIFRMAVEERVLERNPAQLLFPPREAKVGERRTMTKEDIQLCLSVLELRERLIARLAIFAGMRPGEIFGLKWSNINPEWVDIVQRVYRGQIDTPKTRRSVRDAAIADEVAADFKSWRSKTLNVDDGAWVFPSENSKSPLSRDNCWRRHFAPRLREVGLAWVNFQVMRRTHSSKGHEEGIQPKVMADQLGHGVGVNLDVYTRTSRAERLMAVRKLETAILQ